MDKKAVELSMNLIVIAVAALAVLIIFLLVSNGIIGGTSNVANAYTQCEKGQNGKCRDTCEEGEIKLPSSYGCKESYCCRTLNPEALV